mmetsp:Transcript_17406/g.33039  ORF Transcript_17406/g.33039 Transcript_17406/m.33039 type:complete len:191 (-) Transcript_17406:156-728(-)|eukprot:CAMPEP_0170179252 /NCGR_PEP_ID=MMETSP0040_2-20121228/17083_1 /TAXON_ID=641309 /ORGANISM="Lotharella oceanica, Strain CCMP622" /LENGTH=190 /DNA_ID=CAMNT_0010423213 /DNA_START=32 /DNA_END=604 /DNA_ORIENTATION=-
MTTVMIDNYDSFTYNVYQYLSELGAKVVVARNDKITVEEIQKINPINIVISPGPGSPKDAGVSMDVIKAFAGKVPILGICLGHQCIYELYGGDVVVSGEIWHGKTSEMFHDSKGLYKDIPSPFKATRYHSLVGKPETLPKELMITCKTKNGLIQGVRHKSLPIYGVQYHPESCISEHGKKLLGNFLAIKM